MQIYETSDFYLSAFLIAKGINIAGARKAGNRTIFKFNESDTRVELTKEYLNNGSVCVSDFRTAMDTLKTIIYGGSL